MIPRVIVVLIIGTQLLCVSVMAQSQECSADGQCPIAFLCVNGICTHTHQDCNPACPVGQICLDGACTAPTAPPTPPPVPTPPGPEPTRPPRRGGNRRTPQPPPPPQPVVPTGGPPAGPGSPEVWRPPPTANPEGHPQIWRPPSTARPRPAIWKPEPTRPTRLVSSSRAELKPRSECSKNRGCSSGFVCVKGKCVRGDYDGWKYNKNNGYYYYVGVGTFTYAEAVSYCMSANAKVVWFNQSTFMTFQNEMMWVNMIATSSGIRAYWIGAKKMFPGGDLKAGWIWTNDEPLKYFNWRRGQPDGCCGDDVTCVLVNYYDSSGVWEDGGCNRIWRNPQGFICKKEGPEDES